MSGSSGEHVAAGTGAGDVARTSDDHSSKSTTVVSRQKHTKKMKEDTIGKLHTMVGWWEYSPKLREGLSDFVRTCFKGEKYTDDMNMVMDGVISTEELETRVHDMTMSFQPEMLDDDDSNKIYYNYLLLRPDVEQISGDKIHDPKNFRVFIEAVFYVGKGKDDRADVHFKKVAGSATNNKSIEINRIWDAGKESITMKLFSLMYDKTAKNKEACMIDAIGKGSLTNEKSGSYYGYAKDWSLNKRRRLGVCLLYQAYKCYFDKPTKNSKR